MPVLSRFFVFTLLPAGAIVALCYLAVFGSSGWLHAQRIEAELSAANRHRYEIDADVARLQREVDQLRNDEAPCAQRQHGVPVHGLQLPVGCRKGYRGEYSLLRLLPSGALSLR